MARGGVFGCLGADGEEGGRSFSAHPPFQISGGVVVRDKHVLIHRVFAFRFRVLIRTWDVTLWPLGGCGRGAGWW